MGLALLQHLQLRPQVEDDILGCVLPLLGGAAAKPAPDTRHGDAVEMEPAVEGGIVKERWRSLPVVKTRIEGEAVEGGAWEATS